MGSIICAAARSSSIPITGRVITGIGAAGLSQGALAIVTYIAPLEERPLYIVLVISIFGIREGSTLGGALAITSAGGGASHKFRYFQTVR